MFFSLSVVTRSLDRNILCGFITKVDCITRFCQQIYSFHSKDYFYSHDWPDAIIRDAHAKPLQNSVGLVSSAVAFITYLIKFYNRHITLLRSPLRLKVYYRLFFNYILQDFFNSATLEGANGGQPGSSGHPKKKLQPPSSSNIIWQYMSQYEAII